MVKGGQGEQGRETRSEAAQNSSAFPPRRVLVIDDNPDAADSLSMLLTLMGQFVRRAYDVHTALLLAAQFHPEMVFMDLVMPRMDGFELARAIRDTPGMALVPIIAVTGYDDAELRDLTAVAGFHAHLVKPVTLEILSDAFGST